MIDEFEAVLLSAAPEIREEVPVFVPGQEEDPNSWRSEFRSYLDDPE